MVPLIKAKVAGDSVKVFALPPETDKYARKFESFIASDSIFGYDVETTAVDEDQGTFDPDMRMRLIQFGSYNEAWALDPHSDFWRPRIIELMNSTSHRFVTHTNYDALWSIREFGIDLEDRGIDTYTMACLLFPGHAPKDLKDLSTRFIDGQLRDAEQELVAEFKRLAPVNHRVGKKLKAWGFTNVELTNPVYGKYSGFDAIYVRRLLDIFARMLKETGMARLSRNEQTVNRLATQMQVRGLKLDVDWTRDVLGEINKEFNEADSRLLDTFGFSPRSPRRPAWLAERGAKFFEFTDTGAPTLNKDVLPTYADIYENDDVLGPVFRDLVTLSERANIRTNLSKLLVSIDAQGFVHPRIHTNRGITGRMAIVNPPMQTFKKDDDRIRGCFIAADGYTLVGADYDSQEIRIALAFSKDEIYQEIIDKGLNQHDLTAARMSEILTRDVPRPSAKVLNFAQQYGAGPAKIGDQLGMPRKPCIHSDGQGGRKHPEGDANPEAVKLWKAWRKTYKGLVDWTDQMSRLRTVINPYGRVIPADKFRRYANGNYMVQSSGRDVLTGALLELIKHGWGDKIWLPIHDELILQVPEDDASKAVAALEKHMFTQFGDVPLTVSAKVLGKRWSGKD